MMSGTFLYLSRARSGPETIKLPLTSLECPRSMWAHFSVQGVVAKAAITGKATSQTGQGVFRVLCLWRL